MLFASLRGRCTLFASCRAGGCGLVKEAEDCLHCCENGSEALEELLSKFVVLAAATTAMLLSKFVVDGGIVAGLLWQITTHESHSPLLRMAARQDA